MKAHRVRYAHTLDTNVVLCFAASVKCGSRVTAVTLEADGTEIDGDEELLAFDGETLLGLQDGEHWSRSEDHTAADQAACPAVSQDDQSQSTTAAADAVVQPSASFSSKHLLLCLLTFVVH